MLQKMPLRYWMESMTDIPWNWSFEFSQKWPVFLGVEVVAHCNYYLVQLCVSAFLTYLITYVPSVSFWILFEQHFFTEWITWALMGTEHTEVLNLFIKFYISEEIIWQGGWVCFCWHVVCVCMPWASVDMFVSGDRGESVHPYCERVKDGGLQTECTQQRDAMALCNLIDYRKSLPAQYQVAALYIHCEP